MLIPLDAIRDPFEGLPVIDEKVLDGREWSAMDKNMMVACLIPHKGCHHVRVFKLGAETVSQTIRPVPPNHILVYLEHFRFEASGANWTPEKCKPEDAGRVYFIGDSAESIIKIGWADNPECRLAEIQRYSPHPLHIIGTMAGGRTLEGRLHRRFKKLRSHGEWFRAEKQLTRFIRSTLLHRRRQHEYHTMETSQAASASFAVSAAERARATGDDGRDEGSRMGQEASDHHLGREDS